ncbi:SCO7613 C-terminal domain-containing membrane protein, partial [Klenkia sp. PcliD-1-E]|uniref:SCO7613 C-terminal domain-containing membrane protein n=1 Tax=Klenkia sp. PcliD-1-E TaxID=2954492 RepID=UPI002096A0D7
VAVAASRGPDWVPRDAGLAAAATLVLLAAVGTGRAGRWADLGLLMVTTAAAAVLLSVRNRDTRPSTVPIAVGTVALAVVLLTSEGPVSGAAVGAALVAVAVAALAEAVVLAVVLPWWADQRVRAWVRSRVGRGSPPVTGPVDDVRDAFRAADTGRSAEPVGATELDADSPDVRAAGSAAVTGSVVGLLGVGLAMAAGRPGVTAVLLAVLGLALMGHGDVTRGTRPADVPLEEQDTRGRGTRVLGGACLVVAAWSGAALAGWSVVEVVPVAAGAVLLAGTWRALPHGPSWSAWGPGLATALVPSVMLAVVDPTPARQVATLVASLVLVLGGLGWAVRAPFVLGLAGVLGVTIGWLADGAPTPWVVTLFGVGAVLLLVGAVRERQRRRGDPVPARVRTFR